MSTARENERARDIAMCQEELRICQRELANVPAEHHALERAERELALKVAQHNLSAAQEGKCPTCGQCDHEWTRFTWPLPPWRWCLKCRQINKRRETE